MMEENIAFSLLAQLEQHFGCVPSIDQVDFVHDSPTGDLVLYLYYGEDGCFIQGIHDPPARLDLYVLAHQIRQGSTRPEALH